MQTAWIRIAGGVGCLLSLVLLGGCSADAAKADERNAGTASMGPQPVLDLQHHGDHGHGHAHGGGHGHGHAHGHDHAHGAGGIVVAAQYGGVVTRAGEAYAEVVLSDSHELMVHVWSTPDPHLTPPRPVGVDTLGVVIAWEHDTRVFWSLPRKLELVELTQGDGEHKRLYAGQLPQRFETGGKVVLIAPIVWVHGQRETFDIILEVPPLKVETAAEDAAMSEAEAAGSNEAGDHD